MVVQGSVNKDCFHNDNISLISVETKDIQMIVSHLNTAERDI